MDIITTYKTTINWQGYDLDQMEGAVTVQVNGQDEAIFSLESNNEYSPDMVDYTKALDYDVQIMSGNAEELLEEICKNPAKWVS